jgi:uncharacterized membrane protein YoaK (UPF0700 family)
MIGQKPHRCRERIVGSSLHPSLRASIVMKGGQIVTDDAREPAEDRGESSSPQTEARGVRALLVIACVFAIVGGYMDAYCYLAHGGVFANAQTGNVVLVGVYASAGDWGQAARHLPPIAAFILGVAFANLLGVRAQKREFRATLVCQSFELVILIALIAAGPKLPDEWIVPAISFVAAIQNTSFDTIGAWSFNSAMTTGNLRGATTGLIAWMRGRDPEHNRGRAIGLGLICVAFLAGALGGGCYTRLDDSHALAPCAIIVAIGILLTWRERQRRRRLPAAPPRELAR